MSITPRWAWTIVWKAWLSGYQVGSGNTSKEGSNDLKWHEKQLWQSGGIASATPPLTSWMAVLPDEIRISSLHRIIKPITLFFANFTIGWQPIPRVWPNYCILRRSMTGSPVNCDNRRMKEKKASRQEIGQISAQKRCGFSCPGSWLLYTYTWPLSGPFLPPMADHMVNHHMTDFSPKYEKSRGRRFLLFHITLLNSWR